MIKRKTALSLLLWTTLSSAIISYIVNSYNSGYILDLYRNDRTNYAFFSFGTIIALGFCLGKLSEKITDAAGLEIEKIEHFEG